MRNKIKRFKRLAVIDFILQWVLLILPYVVLFTIYNKQWIKTTDDKISFTLGGILCIVVMVLVMVGKTKAMSYGLSKWIFGIVVVWLFKSALNELLIIMCGGFAGYIGFLIFGIRHKNNLKKYEQYIQSARTLEVFNSAEKLEFDKNGNLK